MLVVKNLPANAGKVRDVGSIPGSGRFPWRRAWQPIPVSLPGESPAQRSLEGYSQWGFPESDMTEVIEHAVIFVHKIQAAVLNISLR